MTVTQVIGARYVPLFSEPIDWDNTKTYEPLTIVYYGGNSYTSKQAVPKGIDITNTNYWALTGNYNAQIEQYRKEVTAFDGRIGANTDAIAAETTRATGAEKKNADAIAANTTAINSNTAMLNATAQSPLKTLIDANTTANAEHANMLDGTADSGLKSLIDKNTNSNTTQDAQLAGTSDSGLKTLIEEKPYVIVLGDSWSSSDVSNLWVNQLTEFNMLNFAVGGAAWTFGTTILQQLNNAISSVASNSINVSKIKKIIVYSGANDYRSSQPISVPDGVKNAINTFKTTKAASTLAKVPIVFCMTSARLDVNDTAGNANVSHNNFKYFAAEYCNYLTSLGFAVDYKSYLWCMNNYNGSSFTDNWISDNLHPSETGQNIIASKMRAVIEGNSTVSRITKYVNNYNSDKGFRLTGNATIEDGLLTFTGAITADSASKFNSNGIILSFETNDSTGNRSIPYCQDYINSFPISAYTNKAISNPLNAALHIDTANTATQNFYVYLWYNKTDLSDVTTINLQGSVAIM